MSTLQMKNVCYKYEKNGKNILNNIDYSFGAGKIYAIIGKSGAGKTTLLSLLSSLVSPNSGEILIDGKNISQIDRYKFRSSYIGVVFQSFNLLPHLTAEENVILSMNISGKKYENKKDTAQKLLAKVGLNNEEMQRRILKLSGGQQQRVAIARAISYEPQILLADEPTGNLDHETQNEIMKIFRQLANEGKSIILVTHSPDVAKQADVVYELTKV